MDRRLLRTLIHGLAFAMTLNRLGLSRWDRVAGIVAFNLGIETMQLVVIAIVLPSLLSMSRTKAYPILRIGGALVAGLASIAWIAERLLDVPTPVDAVMNVVARHGVLAAAMLLVISLACKFLAGIQQSQLKPIQDRRTARFSLS